ncbi:OsmC/Ohr family [Cercophora newfieldiana]|uniref:OsmC/Ohr family n=1 Tax=Cercophora newfieldiana TaxID=92897 RepID=A0AA39YCU4_9PEZI|nr:OsmC/Ohr family [Cercophora newfieldiana]
MLPSKCLTVSKQKPSTLPIFHSDRTDSKMSSARLGFLARHCLRQQPRLGPQPLRIARTISSTAPKFQAIPLRIDGHGTGTIQKVSIEGKPYSFTADTYTLLGGQDSAPSPVSYSLASLSSCNQVTGFVVAKDHGITLGKWHVAVNALLPTAVLVKGEQGNPNWESVELEVKVETDIEGGSESAKFQHFVAEVERRCPITQLFKLSGVKYTSKWVNEPL